LNQEEGSVWIFEDISERKQWEQLLKNRIEFLTNPLDSTIPMNFNDLFNLEEIQRIQDAFALATGVASIITDTRGVPITSPSNFTDLCLNIIRTTPQGLANCHRSDAVLGKGNPDGPLVQTCMSGGLLDGGAGIYVGGHHVGNWLVGQVLDDSADPERMMSYAREIGADEEEYREALAKVNRMSGEQFEKVCNALFHIAGQLSVMAMQNVRQAQFITELNQAKEALNASEKRFRETLENVHLIAVTLDVQGVVTFCNAYLCTLCGRTKEQILGANWFDMFIAPEIRDSLQTIFREGISTEDLPSNLEYMIVGSDGKMRSVVWDNTILHNADGSVAGVASIGIDVTDNRHLEEQLRQSQKMEAVGQLAGGIAHDFNNILTVIMGFSNLLTLDDTLNEQQKEQVQQIIDSSERAAKLTGGLLAFSRKQKIDPQHINLNAVVQNVQMFLGRILGEDIQCRLTLHPSDLPVVVDSGQIEQLLINLATNARDAMPHGGILSIETGVQDGIDSVDPARLSGEHGQFAVIVVSDTGSGMDSETQARIFEPFYTTKEVGKGTGLGMAIVYGIVKQHNGFISVYSEPGIGTTFKIYLPILEADQGGDDEAAAPALPEGGRETILLAEDDPAVRNLVVTILRKFGYDVIQAEDGKEAIDLFAANQGRISMVIMDMIMPRKNGKEAYDEISLIQPGVKVLYSSGYTADFIKDRGVSEDGIDLLMKPVHPLELLRKVREILNRPA